MAKGRRKPIEQYRTAVLNHEVSTPAPVWGVDVRVKKCLIHHYRIPGKVGDIVNVPAELVEKMLQLKQVELI